MRNYEDPLWSQLYDAMHSGDGDDLSFYLEEAGRAKGPVLEVACGTGRILLPMLVMGIDALGIDVSHPMLTRLREKASRTGLLPKVVQADMRQFSLAMPFSLIVVPFRSFLHLETQEDQLAALSCFREHLAPDGRLILNFSSPGLHVLAGHDDRLRFAREFVDSNSGRILKAWQTVKNDLVAQRQTIGWVLQDIDGHGNVVRTADLSLSLRWIYKSEFELLLKAAGYTRWTVYGGFNGEALEREDQEMVWIAYP